MPTVSRTHRVYHCAEDMFDLVADVEKYPEFVPLCHSLKVQSRRQIDVREVITAEMRVKYKMFSESYSSRVLLDRKNHSIEVTYLDGPFEYLNNNWKFVPIDEGNCEVLFDLDYQLKSRSLQLVMGSVFDIAFSRFTTAFEQRADAIYGKHSR